MSEEVKSAAVEAAEAKKEKKAAKVDPADFSAVKAALNKQKKLSIRLPKPKQKESVGLGAEAVDDSVPVCINGYIYQVKRGVTVEVPETVAKILEEAGYLDG